MTIPARLHGRPPDLAVFHIDSQGATRVEEKTRTEGTRRIVETTTHSLTRVSEPDGASVHESLEDVRVPYKLFQEETSGDYIYLDRLPYFSMYNDRFDSADPYRLFVGSGEVTRNVPIDEYAISQGSGFNYMITEEGPLYLYSGPTDRTFDKYIIEFLKKRLNVTNPALPAWQGKPIQRLNSNHFSIDESSVAGLTIIPRNDEAPTTASRRKPGFTAGSTLTGGVGGNGTASRRRGR